MANLKGVDAFGKVRRTCVSPVDRVLMFGDIQTAEDVKIKTKTGAFCT